MTIHLIRMAVGIDDVAHHLRVQDGRMADDDKGRLRIYTRNTPKRAAELIEGGSIYWIIRGYIRSRQRIVDIERLTDTEGRGYCAIELDPEYVLTVLQARRPQQGWRYLEPAEAPDDRPEGGGDSEDMPPELAAELRALGLI